MDIAFVYQGLPDASVQDYLSTLGVDNKLSSGHSLGTLSNIYLGSNGLIGKVYLYSVPFGAVAPPNAEVMLGTWEHSFDNYKKYIAK